MASTMGRDWPCRVMAVSSRLRGPCGRCAGSKSRLEDVGDDHASAAARTCWTWIGRLVRRCWLGSHRPPEKLASAGDVALAAGTGEQAIVADAVEARRQDMQQKAPNKLVGMERHDAIALAAAAAVVFVAECHARFVERDQAAVRDRNPMSVARQVSKYGLGS